MITLKFEDDVTLDEVEEALILYVLSKNKFNKTVAAKKLGISLRAMSNKVEKYRKAGYKIPSYNYFQDLHGVKDFSQEDYR